MTTEKACKICGKMLPASAFRPLPHTFDGLDYRCHSCYIAYLREYTLKKALAKVPAVIQETFRFAPMERLRKLGSKIRIEDNGCWAWTGNTHPNSGYGRMWMDRHHDVLAHRLAYEWAIGPIPEGLVIDHLCRNRACVNPAHLEPVSLIENVMRGESFAAQNARKTHCHKGHEFTPENTLRVASSGARVCKICRSEYKRARRAAAKATLISTSTP